MFAWYVGKIALRGLLPNLPGFEDAVFGMLDACNLVLQRVYDCEWDEAAGPGGVLVPKSDGTTAKCAAVHQGVNVPEFVAQALTTLEVKLPICELDFKLHELYEIARHIPILGPPLAHACWSHERYWHVLNQKISNRLWPEACVMKGHVRQRALFYAGLEEARNKGDSVLDPKVDKPLRELLSKVAGGVVFGKSLDPLSPPNWYYNVYQLGEDKFTPQAPGVFASFDEDTYLVPLHRFWIANDAVYEQAWTQFVPEWYRSLPTGRERKQLVKYESKTRKYKFTPRGWVVALRAWRLKGAEGWSLDDDMPPLHSRLAMGPVLDGLQFAKAVARGHDIKAGDHVLVQSEDDLDKSLLCWFGKVKCIMQLRAPGHHPLAPRPLQNLVLADWYEPVHMTSTKGWDTQLRLPTFESAFKDAPTGPVCKLEDVVTTQIFVTQHPTKPRHKVAFTHDSFFFQHD